MILRILYFLTLVGLIFFYATVPSSMDKGLMTGVLLVGFLTVLLFATRKEGNIELRGQFLKHSTIFLLGFIIVHFQLYIDYIIGNFSFSNTFIWVDTSVVLETLVLSTIGLVSFLLGYMLCRERSVAPGLKLESRIMDCSILIGINLIGLIIYFITVNPLYLMGYYGEEKVGTEATYAIMVYRLTFYAIVIQNCRNILISGKIPKSFLSYVKMQGYFFTALLIIYLFSVLLSGDRGPLMTFSLCYLSGYYFVTKRKLSLKYGLVFVMLGATFITVLGQVRRLDSQLSFYDRFVQSINAESRNKEESFIPQTQELASSVKALHHAVNSVPSEHEYLFGRFQFQQITSAIPFFDSFNPVIFDDQHYKYGSSARFVTWLFQGDFPSYGNGTTCIADFYLDFGLLGVIFGMLIFGYFIRFSELALYSSQYISITAQVFSVVYLSSAIYISRSTVLFQFKSVVLILLILMFNKFIINYKR